MGKAELPGGVVHRMPPDMKDVLRDHDDASTAWHDITPLARNEWICWVLDAKQDETRARRIERAREDLSKGKRRPCCWPGCSHRERNGKP